MIFTTSWDDGYVKDLELAALLKEYHVRGTFYVCPAAQHGQEMLSDDQIRSLDRDGFEVGSHTIHHPRLTTKSDAEVSAELSESKARLEGILGHDCTMFCYPKGDHDGRIARLAAQAGYHGARTVEQLRFDVGSDPFVLPTTLHVYSFPWRGACHRWQHVLDPLGPLRVKWPTLTQLNAPLAAYTSWLGLARFLWRKAVQTQQPVFHLWGHSEEVARLGLWEDLRTFLAEVMATPDVEPLTNGQLVDRLFPHRR